MAVIFSPVQTRKENLSSLARNKKKKKKNQRMSKDEENKDEGVCLFTRRRKSEERTTAKKNETECMFIELFGEPTEHFLTRIGHVKKTIVILRIKTENAERYLFSILLCHRDRFQPWKSTWMQYFYC